MKRLLGLITGALCLAQATGGRAEELNPKGLAVAKLMLVDDIRSSLEGGRAIISKDGALSLTGSDVVTTANAYAQTFDDNELAADKQFGGKRIVINGLVRGISKDALGNPYLALAGKNQFSDVIARLRPDAVDQALTLKKGISVTLVCKSGTKVLTSSSLNNCRFLAQHLDLLGPTYDKAIIGFLSGNETFPKPVGDVLAFSYLVGASLPDNSPCLADATKCNDEFKRFPSNKENKRQYDEMLARLKTK